MFTSEHFKLMAITLLIVIVGLKSKVRKKRPRIKTKFLVANSSGIVNKYVCTNVQNSINSQEEKSKK